MLFLDELAEFDRGVLDALRQPLEEGSIEISRAVGQVRYPARLQLVAAMNPCRCGYFADPDRPCRCPVGEPERYVRRISGPLMDRIDLYVELGRVDPAQLLAGAVPEDSAAVRQRTLAARARGLERNEGRPNAALTGAEALVVARLEPGARDRLADLAGTHRLSARATHRILRVARSVADLRAIERVDEQAVLAALALRERDGILASSLAA